MEVFGADTVASCPSTLMGERQVVELPPHASGEKLGKTKLLALLSHSVGIRTDDIVT